jgi:hypothetical protein
MKAATAMPVPPSLYQEFGESKQEFALRKQARVKAIEQTPPITFHKYISDRKKSLEKIKKG